MESQYVEVRYIKESNSFRGIIRLIYKSKKFKCFSLLLTFLYCILIPIEANSYVKEHAFSFSIITSELIFFTCFTFELLIRMIYLKFKFFKDFFNNLDAFSEITQVIILIMLFNNNYNALLSISSIKILRFLRYNKNLKRLFFTIGQATVSSFYLIVILAIFIIIFAYIGHHMLSSKLPDPWGDLRTAMLSIFSITTKDSWFLHQKKIEDNTDLGMSTRWFTTIVVILCGILLSNLLVAAVTDTIISVAERQTSKEVQRRMIITEKYKLIKEKAESASRNKSKSDIELIENIEETELDNYPNIGPQENMFANPNYIKSLKILIKDLIDDYQTKIVLHENLIGQLHKIAGKKPKRSNSRKETDKKNS